jgi:6-pyruvoyl-tetrahydropterin synthase
MHGATYVIDLVFSREDLDADSIVVDIALAHEVLGTVKKELNYQNLDELDVFSGKLTTTEFLAQHVHGRVAGEMGGAFVGHLKVVLNESHVAWASYEGPVG